MEIMRGDSPLFDDDGKDTSKASFDPTTLLPSHLYYSYNLTALSMNVAQEAQEAMPAPAGNRG